MREDNTRWVYEASSSSPAGHLATPESRRTLCGLLVGKDRAEPKSGALTRCTECVIQNMIELGEIRMVTRTRTQELSPPVS